MPDELRPDSQAIAATLEQALKRQRQAYLAHPVPGLAERKSDLRRLARFVREHKDAICDAISADFGHRSRPKDKATGKQQRIAIKASSGLSEEEIKQMIRDAEAHAAEDKKFRELAETRNRADALLHATEKAVKDLGDKVTGEERVAIEAAISDLRGVLKGDDQSAIEHKAEALAKASAPVVQRAYQAEGQGGAGAAADAQAKPGADAAKDDVLDAEFEEIKDKGQKPH